jgi:hypothetical protein
MKHRTVPRFWHCYAQLPKDARGLADKNFELLKTNPYHPSLHLKKVDDAKKLWLVRIGLHYRALGVETADALVWFWVGSHAEYDALIAGA